MPWFRTKTFLIANLTTNQSYSCPGCQKSNKTKGNKSSLLICIYCGQVVQNETSLTIPQRVVPDDWSIIQLGTKGLFKNKAFEVIGRIRLQQHREYRNYWSIWYPIDMKYGWLVESLGSYAVCTDAFFEYTDEDKLNTLKPDQNLLISADLSLCMDELDRCEAMSYSGEIPSWSFFAPPFSVVHGKRGKNMAAFFHLSPDKNTAKFLVGEWITFEDLKLQQINIAHEWRA